MPINLNIANKIENIWMNVSLVKFIIKFIFTYFIIYSYIDFN